MLLRTAPHRTCLLSLALPALCLAVGCESDSTIYGKVGGRVTAAGKPVVEAVVLFEEPDQIIYIQTATDSDGRYSFDQMRGGGLPVGHYRIALQQPIQEIRTGEPLPPPKAFPNIDARFLDPDQSGLTLEVKAGENPFDIALNTLP